MAHMKNARVGRSMMHHKFDRHEGYFVDGAFKKTKPQHFKSHHGKHHHSINRGMSKREQNSFFLATSDYLH